MDRIDKLEQRVENLERENRELKLRVKNLNFKVKLMDKTVEYAIDPKLEKELQEIAFESLAQRKVGRGSFSPSREGR